MLGNIPEPDGVELLYNPSAWEAPEGSRCKYLMSRAGSLGSLGLRRSTIEFVLEELAEDYCENFAEFAPS
jgi:hypothetical protein